MTPDDPTPWAATPTNSNSTEPTPTRQGSSDSTFPASRVMAERDARVKGLVEITPTPVAERRDLTTRKLLKTPDGLDPLLIDRIARLRGSMIAGGAHGRYIPTGRLGAGSQGVVWTVTDRDCHRDLAFKLLPGETASPEDLARFVLEAQITAQLEHPGIVPVHDLGRLDDGTLYYSMKRVEGEALADHLADRSGRPEHRFELLQVFLAICQTMAYAHTKGVIHRDLKPRNIMVGRFGEVLIMDWGLAKLVGTPEDSSAVQSDRLELAASAYETMIGTAVGTPAYMSPEQAAGETNGLDQRCDIYALGVILYEMLCGVSPYDRGDLQRVLKQAREGSWHRIDRRKEGAGVPKPLIAVAHKAMARECDQRYQRVESLAEDVRAFLAGRKVSAYREGAVERLQRWALRHALPLKVGAAVTGVALLLAFTTWIYLEEDRRRTAEVLRVQAQREEAAGRLDEALGSTQRLLGVVPEDAKASATRARLEATIARAAEEDVRRATERSRVASNRAEAQRKVEQAEAAVARGGEADLVAATEHYMAALGLTPEDTTIRAAYEKTYSALVHLRREANENERRKADRASADFFVVSAKRQFTWAEQFREQADSRLTEASRLRAQPDSLRDSKITDRIRELEEAADRDLRIHATHDANGVDKLDSALKLVPDHPEANQLMADWCVRALQRAEARDDQPQAAALTVKAKRHDLEGRYTDVLAGVAQVTLSTGSQTMQLAPLVESTDRVLRPLGHVQTFSEGEERSVPSGRWLASSDGWVQALLLARGEKRTLKVTVPPVLHPEIAYIPDSTVFDRNQRPVATVGAFAIAKREVTQGDYLTFLNDPSTLADVEAAIADKRGLRYPRSSIDRKTPLWNRDADGFFQLMSPSGETLDPHVPITGISLSDALAYAGWRAARESLAWRLPSHLEWQAAIQGGDGRPYPWGTRFESRLCLSRASDEFGMPALAPGGSHPDDTSVQGVADLAGSVSELLAPLPGATGLAWTCGGSFRDRDPTDFSWEAIHRIERDVVSPAIGFRLALSLP